ncbi:MAG: peptidylprolyl isomerase [Pseudomonadota bacterium]
MLSQIKAICGLFALAVVLNIGALNCAKAAPFDTAIRVNDGVITEFEIEQRELLLQIFGATGNIPRLAEEQLIEDRLKEFAARLQGVTADTNELIAGYEEFAQRGGLSTEELISLLEAQGVYRETYEDFVRSGVLWRKVVGSRFGLQGAVSQNEIDTAISVGTADASTIELRLSEIVINFQDRGEEGARALANRLRQEILRGEDFRLLAAQYSDAPTAPEGGLRDWTPAAGLPSTVTGPLFAGGVGSLSEPVEVGPAIGLFLLRGTRTNASLRQNTTVEYMTVPLGGVSSEVTASLLDDVDTCNDLRTASNAIQPNLYRVSRELERAVPASYAPRLSQLDLNEARIFTGSNGALEVVMVCAREADLQEDARARLRNILGNSRVESFGEAYLQELLGNATITRF